MIEVSGGWFPDPDAIGPVRERLETPDRLSSDDLEFIDRVLGTYAGLTSIADNTASATGTLRAIRAACERRFQQEEREQRAAEKAARAAKRRARR
jgi:hypothetical protein